MTDQEIRLKFGEMNAGEMRLARALVEWHEREIASLKAALAESEKQFQDKVYEIGRLLDVCDKAQGILKDCLAVMPFGNIKTHTFENLPGRIADLASEIASLSLENERLEAKLTEVVEAAGKAGWNGVENSKHLPTFIENLAEDLSKAQAELAARPAAAEITGLKAALFQAQEAAKELLEQRDKAQAEISKWHAELSAVMPADFKDWHENAQAEWPFVAAQVIRNLRAREDSALDMAEKVESRLKPEIEALHDTISRLKAELAALRQPILADDGRSLGEMASEAYHEAYGVGIVEKWQRAAQVVAAVVLAQAVRRMEAVPWRELDKAWDEASEKSLPQQSLEACFNAVRARLIAAAKGEGQPVVVNEPPQHEGQPDLSGESEKQTEEPAWISHGWDGSIIAYRVQKWKPGFGSEAKAEPAQPWTPAVGDVVRLKSGGPAMTVTDIDPLSLMCVWMNADDELQVEPITTLCLEPASHE